MADPGPALQAPPPLWILWVCFCKFDCIRSLYFICSHHYNYISLHWITVDTRLQCTDLQVIHDHIALSYCLTGETQLHSTDLQVIHDYSAPTYRWYTITLYWLTGDTRSHCTDLRLIHDILHWLTGVTRSHCTDLQVIHNYTAMTYKSYIITLHRLHND